MVEKATLPPRGSGSAERAGLPLRPEAEETVRRAVRLASMALHTPVALLGVPVEERLLLAAQLGVPEPWASARSLPLRLVPCRHALARLQPVLIDDLDADPLTRDDLRLAGFPRGAYCGMALWLADEPVAVLSVVDSKPRRWTGPEVGLLRDICAGVVRELELLSASDAASAGGAPPPPAPLPEGVGHGISEQKYATPKLAEVAFHDPLTALPNRALLLDRLERLLRRSRRRPDYQFALLLVDLDHFEAVNDTPGDPAGDRLLREVARRLECCIRQEDTVARVGGDEFAILLDSIADVTAAVQVAERALEQLASPFEPGLCDQGLGASIGIALSVTGYETVDAVLRDADAARSRARQEGRGRCVVFDSELSSRMRVQLAFERELHEALQRNQLALHYQPVVALEQGTIPGMEALLRWAHPERGLLLPESFLPLAERTGLIVEIGWWVLREACRQLRAWQQELPRAASSLTMSVNLSARQFQQPDMVQQLDAILKETGIEPEYLRLELTETVVAQDAELAAALLAQIHERGIGIWIDDFGTGRSSLQELGELPISMLKIAPDLVRGLGEPGSGSIVQTIIALGRSMAIEAIAEGVETPQQLQQLRALGARFAQGFLFSLPLDSVRAGALIAR